MVGWLGELLGGAGLGIWSVWFGLLWCGVVYGLVGRSGLGLEFGYFDLGDSLLGIVYVVECSILLVSMCEDICLIIRLIN